MRAATFWKTVTADRAGLLDEIVSLLRQSGIHFCVVGGQGVNAYVEPVVSLDLDLAAATHQIETLERLLQGRFRVTRHAHRLNVGAAGSDLRVQFQLDPRYAEFVPRAAEREILGINLPVARVEDVLQGKVWAAQDPQCRASKRQKDLADIARLLERYPQLRVQVPADV